MANKKQTSRKVATLGSKLMKKDLTRKQEKSVGASVVSQSRGKNKKKK